ncbi:TPA: 50S ribosomal protein L29 [Candidatus Dependentiae bacterium]|nr:MAG: hypothetical protein UR14_C0005G0043 [candidate division TM6 bacterium GW2011_GWE2_31_21]KKP53119.1 MAG: hypothetical protein UR43_C0007G0043 [candidate division TM6 bacterium GW2011_GWF2_33_332]HBS47938.1 50S ribosomal protein L29 [Candidatus Dependentiae bacterium]HBZ73458.1 50S ribosomal protein L29 [Candidatus Dependentiae bacterium]
MNKTDLTTLDNKALILEVEQLKKEYFNLKLNVSTTSVKDYSQFKKLKRRIARALTLIKQQKNNNS